MKNSCKILCALVLTAALALSLASCDLSSLFGTPDCGEGNHVWSEDYTSVTPASCGQNETGYYTCTVCEKQGETVEIADTALSHIWSTDHTTATPAECGKNETGYKTCTLCDTKGETEEIPDTALEHTWSEDYTTDAAATCKGNATAYYTCTACEAKGESFEIEGTKLDHVWSETYTIDKAGVCLENSTGHRVCVNCETADVTVELPDTAPGHRWSEDYQIATEASCTNEATGYKICLDCEEIGAVETVPNSMLPHTWSADYTIDTAASCDVNATGHKVCTVCKTADETVTIEGTALAHDFTAEVEKADYKIAETAHDYYKSCKNCGKADPAGSKFTAPHKYDQKVANDDTFVSAATTAAPETYKLSCECGVISDTETFTVGYPTFTAGGGALYNDILSTGTRYDYDVLEGFAGQTSEKAYANITHNAEDGNVTLDTLKSPWQPNYTPAAETLTGGTFAFEVDIFFSDFKVTTSDKQLGFIGFSNLGATCDNTRMFALFYLNASTDAEGNVDYLYFGEAKNVQLDTNTWYNLRIIVKDDPADAGIKSLADVYVNGYLVAADVKTSTGANTSITNNTSVTGFTWQFRTQPGQVGSTVTIDNAFIGIPHGDNHTFDQENINAEGALVSEATAQSPAVYYKSCACGVVSTTETFTYGSPLFEAGNGVYYNANKDTSASNFKTYDYTEKEGFSNYNNVTHDADAGTIKISGDTWVSPYLILAGASTSAPESGTVHVFETDLYISEFTVTNTAEHLGFWGFGNTSGQSESRWMAFLKVYANAENGTAKSIYLKGDDASVITLNVNTWYNLRIVAKDDTTTTDKTFDCLFDIYLNGVLVYADFNPSNGWHADLNNNTSLGGFGMQWRNNAGQSGLVVTLDNTYIGTETPEE